MTNQQISEDEMIARFSLSKKDVRADGTIRTRLYLPPQNLELSACRHGELDNNDLILSGREVANQRGKDLFGWGDTTAATYTDQNLVVSPDPLPKIPNHVVATGWPDKKEEQMAIAQELAIESTFVKVV